MAQVDLKQIASVANNLSALVIEDEAETNERMVKTLSMIFGDVYSACNGVEGLEMYKKHRPSIIFVDIIMPNMDGIDLIREIKSIDSEQIIVVVSATDQLEKITESIKIGVNSFIQKPVDSKELIDTLKQIVNLSKKPKKIETKTFSIKIPLDIYEVIEEEAYQKKTSKNAVILELLQEQYQS
jgi:YesN/AraC family two-component response regulator